MKDYVQSIDFLTRKVIWKEFSNFPIPKVQNRDLENRIKERILFKIDIPDRIVWAPSKIGDYTMKQGYKAVTNNGEHIKSQREFSFCWNVMVLPKADWFAWLALKIKILTSDKISRIGILTPFKCVLCEEAFEDVNHLFVQCSLAQNYWTFIQSKLS